jgi:hypothetical protein
VAITPGSGLPVRPSWLGCLGSGASSTRVATLFPNEASLLRLASAVLSEISDDWKTERAFLNIEAR